ncbi:MAG: ABC transporter ATP-binding protein/permease [Candidatus Moeniiplasma glomeromycotorum]|nr:ABC transporter ATP-binding protein/permease [Candidatus Moeniiplasma glomeromycotorum]MCE8167396.1 ABC transporter ATP-binding protein/permease [Candidatus Moeniiplasma glomeromycotorum]MCE8168590.1 ABC transporter ATP-binding protein/permease [Candidatus Moeniiplasma glomeromycotorum]
MAISPPTSTSPLQVNFRTLYRKFKKRVISHFLITIPRALLISLIFGAIVEMFRTEITPTSNCLPLLIPKPFRPFFGDYHLSRGKFILICLVLVSIYAFSFYWDYLWEEELRVKGGHFTKNLLLEKFRRLPFETQKSREKEVSKLVENDSWKVGNYWEHLPNHIFHSSLDILINLVFYWSDLKEMWMDSPLLVFFCIGWLILLNSLVHFFTRLILRNEKEYKKKLEEEWAVINRETSQINLISSMGLTETYQQKQARITGENEVRVLNYSRTKSLSKTLPRNLLLPSFPFLLLFLSWKEFKGVILVAFWSIFGNIGSILWCLWDYADYASSRARINTFLALPERNDNLTGIKLDSHWAIQEVRFENIFFRYSQSEKWVLRNYQRTFAVGKINHLRGANGTGKSTILYLLLGQIVPQEGKITLILENGKTYDLLKQINLDHWRKNNLAYCAHENLVEKGSTGQRQLANLEQILTQRQASQIFCFDEADNALDVKNQAELQEKLQTLVKKGKLVVYIKH